MRCASSVRAVCKQCAHRARGRGEAHPQHPSPNPNQRTHNGFFCSEWKQTRPRYPLASSARSASRSVIRKPEASARYEALPSALSAGWTRYERETLRSTVTPRICLNQAAGRAAAAVAVAEAEAAAAAAAAAAEVEAERPRAGWAAAAAAVAEAEAAAATAAAAAAAAAEVEAE
eukprot:scaffold77743_cov67-Phaeocystis_antarctica.AAC.1